VFWLDGQEMIKGERAGDTQRVADIGDLNVNLAW